METRTGKLTLILGGARSGKSAYAQRLAQDLGGENVLFVATSQALDEEMESRIQKHRRERPAAWPTLEAPREVGQAILQWPGSADVVLVDCLTVLVSNLLLEHEDDPFARDVEAQIDAEVESLLACVQQRDARFIVVSNEVGMGLVPGALCSHDYDCRTCPFDHEMLDRAPGVHPSSLVRRRRTRR